MLVSVPPGNKAPGGWSRRTPTPARKRGRRTFKSPGSWCGAPCCKPPGNKAPGEWSRRPPKPARKQGRSTFKPPDALPRDSPQATAERTERRSKTYTAAGSTSSQQRGGAYTTTRRDVRNNTAAGRSRYRTVSANSAKGTWRCSPVRMSLTVAAPASSSCEPTITTWGMPRRLAYSICFFILLASG